MILEFGRETCFYIARVRRGLCDSHSIEVVDGTAKTKAEVEIFPNPKGKSKMNVHVLRRVRDGRYSGSRLCSCEKRKLWMG